MGWPARGSRRLDVPSGNCPEEGRDAKIWCRRWLFAFVSRVGFRIAMSPRRLGVSEGGQRPGREGLPGMAFLSVWAMPESCLVRLGPSAARPQSRPSEAIAG